MNDSGQETGYEVSRRNKNDFWFACVDIAVIRDPTIPPMAKAVYAVICSHVNTRSRSGPLRVKTIAKEVGCDDRTVRRSLDALEEKGLIERKRVFEDGSQKASIIFAVGYNAPCYQDGGVTPAPEGVTPVTGGEDTRDTTPGGTHVTPSLREPNIDEIKDNPPTPPAGGSVDLYPPDFEAFYTAYPRKAEKRAAFKHWKTLKRQGVNLADVTRAAETYGKVMAWKGTPVDKIKHPSTFLHEDRWRDWLPPNGAAYLEARALAQSRRSNVRPTPRPQVVPPSLNREKRDIEKRDFSEEELERMMAKSEHGEGAGS